LTHIVQAAIAFRGIGDKYAVADRQLARVVNRTECTGSIAGDSAVVQNMLA